VRCGVYEYGRGSAKKLALEGASVIATCIGVALVIAFSLPAEAKNKPKSPVSTEVIIPDPANGEPMTLIVSLRDQTGHLAHRELESVNWDARLCHQGWGVQYSRKEAASPFQHV